MNSIELLLIISFGLSLFLMLTRITLLGCSYYYQQKSRLLVSGKRIKNKRKKRQLEAYRFYSQKLLLCGGISDYVMYNQQMTMSKEDQNALVDGYYLTADFEKELQTILEKDIDETKSIQNIQSLGSLMASYSSKRANHLTQQKGQQKFNKYYQTIKELGINATTQSQEMVTNKEILDNYLVDVKKVEGIQKDIFKFYKVDETELEKN
ncbi:hypothetical protein [Vagococcus fluvialis]|uniref:hypothetical protein n=2 Tax=Vagococcus fluvialis TaxID=2738 RepID=UPI00288D84B4|nr:hypothetical protein [Vagococcus fluvialis]MDT2782949.1 hypothetical protein [Vagococcus fluvialis]WNF89495.1 hypothetical protein QDW48_10140 [Vagococcus fluvialis]